MLDSRFLTCHNDPTFEPESLTMSVTANNPMPSLAGVKAKASSVVSSTAVGVRGKVSGRKSIFHRAHHGP